MQGPAERPSGQGQVVRQPYVCKAGCGFVIAEHASDQHSANAAWRNTFNRCLEAGRLAGSTLAILICGAAGAHAQPANQRADTEARAFLPPCREQNEQHQQQCLANQQSFVEQYIYAKAGDILAMGSTATSFGQRRGDHADSQWLGIPESAVQACAWRLVRFERSHEPLDEDGVHRICDPLPAKDHAVAVARATVLAHELDTAPAKLPDAG